MKKLLLDPAVFNYVLCFMYSANIVRWALAKSIADAFYWFFALGITLTVTFLYKR